MEIKPKEKIEILLTMIKENNVQIIWLKDLDFKIVYYSVVLLFATLTWLATTTTAENSQLLFMYRYFSLILVTLSTLFLIRNHFTHWRIRFNNRRMLGTLGLFKKNIYGTEPPVTYSNDFMFHMGRFIYFVILVISGTTSTIASCYFLRFVK